MSDNNWKADGKLWPTIQPPLVPTDEDVGLLLDAAAPALEGLSGPPRILVLGVTSALLDVPWPEGSEVHSVDYDKVMIGLFWKGAQGRHCHCDHWQSMPLPDGYFDLVVGDCSFNALPGIGEYAAVLKEIARVSRPGAPLLCRFFMQPEPRLTPESIISLTEGMGAAPARLLLAIACADEDGGLSFGEVAGRVAETQGDLDAYLVRLGHDPADIERTWAVLRSDQRLNYPTRAQIQRAFEPYYSRIEFAHPGYAVGRYCPMVSFA